jgi:thiamine-phosphate pyrophosphorylase
MRLVVITPSRDVPDEHSLVTKMMESGLRTLHLRKPKYTTSQMAAYIRQIPPHFHNRIVIHSHHKLALRFPLKGIHLGRTHLASKWKYWFVRMRLRMKLSKLSKSRSYTRLQQVYQPEEQEFDYYFLGTIFNNMTGELYSGFYEDAVLAANGNSGKTLIARGGTTAKSVEKAHRFGFAGIAFNSYLWNSDKPYESFSEVLSQFRSNNIPLE